MSDASHEVLTASFDHVSETVEPVVWTTLVRVLLQRDGQRTKGNAMFVKFQDEHYLMAQGYADLENIRDPDAIQSSDRSKVGLLDLPSPSESIATLQCSWSVHRDSKS